MNVNSISSTNFGNRYPNTKTIKGALKNGETGFLEFSSRHCFAYSDAGNGAMGTVGHYEESKKMLPEYYEICIKKLTAIAADGVDFVKEFCEAMKK